MFTSLLPGFRHLRAPLAAGVVWLAVGWLLWGRHLPRKSHATGLLQDLYELADYLGPATTITGFTFVAYLIGELWTAPRRARDSTSDSNPVLRLLMLYRFDSWLPERYIQWRGDIARVILFENGGFDDLFPRLGVRRPTADELLELPVSPGDFGAALSRDFDRTAAALPEVATELRADYDQHIAEYSFRQDLATPLAALTGAAAWNAPIDWTITLPEIGQVATFPWVCALAVWLFLLASALHTRRGSQYILLTAIYLGRVPAPAITEFGRQVFGPAPSSASHQGATRSEETVLKPSSNTETPQEQGVSSTEDGDPETPQAADSSYP